MGLFLGFSFVSIAELIYFAVIRPYRSIRKFQKSKEIYENMENGFRKCSSKKSKTRNGSIKKHYNIVSPSMNFQNDKNHLLKNKMPLPYLLSNEFEKSDKGGNYTWLE